MVLQKFQMPRRVSSVVEHCDARHWQVSKTDVGGAARMGGKKSSSCTAAAAVLLTTIDFLYKLPAHIIEDNLEYFVMVGCNLGDIWKNVFSVCELTRTNAQVVAVHTGDFDIFLMSAWDLKTGRVKQLHKKLGIWKLLSRASAQCILP